MAITNGYATLNELKARVNIDVGDTADDAALERVIEAASRAIDGVCKRRFYTSAAETRTFTANSPDVLFVDDLQSVTTLKTDDNRDRTYERTWTTDDYDLMPENAAFYGEPYLRIEASPLGDFRFPRHAKGVQITGTWGYASTVPPGVHEACLLWAQRLWKRVDTPLGIAANNNIGELMVKMPPPDKDVKTLLVPYIKGRELV